MELKTLKDLKKDWENYEIGKDEDETISILVLKQEAIKQVKEIETKNHHGFGTGCTDWIKYFFNITEEDLKN